MAEEQLKESNDIAGPSEQGLDEGQTTQQEPAADVEGQSDVAGDQTTEQDGSESAAEDAFFDPKSIQDRPELVAAYKQMQSAYTKKMQAISENRNKIEAYDAFQSNPVESIQRIAAQYGYHLTPAQAREVAAQQGQLAQQPAGEDWQPQNWNDVLSRAKDMAKQEIMQELNPVMNQVQSMRRDSIENQLSEIDPTWHQYEDDMRANLNTHPTLAQDPVKLYRLSVPPEVLESRATQAALAKLETRQESAKITGKSTTNRAPSDGMPDKAMSFNEAVEFARKKLASQGIRRG